MKQRFIHLEFTKFNNACVLKPLPTMPCSHQSGRMIKGTGKAAAALSVPMDSSERTVVTIPVPCCLFPVVCSLSPYTFTHIIDAEL